MLTGTGGRASKRSLIVRFTVSGQAPCSGAERRSKVLDEVSAAENVQANLTKGELGFGYGNVNTQLANAQKTAPLLFRIERFVSCWRTILELHPRRYSLP